jgi:ribosomal protein S15P/S13E
MNPKKDEVAEREAPHLHPQSDKAEKIRKKPSWIKMKKEELEKLILNLAKEGNGPAKIGLILRDKHGIPRTRLFGRKLTQILDKSKEDYLGETRIIEGKTDKLRKHIAKNKHDYPASRALTKKLWMLHSREA